MARFHDAAHDWFDGIIETGWATCPIVENGVVRILGHPRYEGGPGSVAGAFALLQPWLREEHHRFWPDSLSLFDTSRIEPQALGAAGRITDAYLLGLAVSRGGKFATFDRRLSPAGVWGGTDAIHIIA